MPQAEVNGAHIYYEVQGEGIPLALSQAAGRILATGCPTLGPWQNGGR